MLTQTRLRRQLRSINDIEVGVFGSQIALHLGRKPRLQLLHRPRTVQQERAAILQVLGQVILLDVCRCVAGHEIGSGHQIRAADRRIAEAQMALGQAAGLHGVIGEVCLRVFVGHQTDGADGILVGAHRAVTAQAPNLAGDLAGMRELYILIIQRGMCHIIVDTDGEAVLGRFLPQIVIHGNQLAGGGVLRAKAIAAAHHADVAAPGLIQRRDHVQIHRLAYRTGLLAAVQHGDALAGGGNGSREVRHGEGTVQMDLYHTHLTTVGIEIVHRLVQCLSDGAHGHDYLLGIRCAVVVKQLVIPACQRVDLVHVVLHRSGHDGGLDVGALLALEVYVGVDVVAAVGGMLRVQRLAAERLQRVVVDKAPQILVVQRFDALHFMTGAKAIETVHEGVLSLDSGQMCHRRQIHSLLGRGGHQHGVAGGTAGHKVRMISKDRMMVAGDHAGSNVHHAGEELSAHSIHGRDHQHQTLRGGKGGGQGTCLKGAVAGTGGTRLGLHLDHVHRCAEQVLFPLGGPLVYLFRHGRGRRYRIDCRYLGKCVGRMGGGGIAVHDHIIFLTHIHLYL